MDNPMTWSVPFMRAAGIAVRVHAVFLIYVAIRLARSLAGAHEDDPAPLGFGLTALDLGCLFVIVLLHEFGHCFACRWSGGTSDEILMWPLGGLAFCRPPQDWRAHFITAAGGPMVNVVICVVLAPILGIMTGEWWGVAIPNPFGPIPAAADSWWLLVLFTIQDVSLLLLLFNLLPIFPLDGGRICQACLWPRFGYVRSMRLAVYTGYVGAIGLGILGAVMQMWTLVAIAIFGGVTCYVTLKQLQWTQAFMGAEDDLYAQSLWGDPEDEKPAKPSRAERKAAEAAEAAESESRELDRILAKIGAEGMDSLTTRERRLLEQATERKRKEEA
jgi:Zn-dependent protease